ncbi:hypothetical protein SeMB42_g04185 [Synchytrium endobioticum]|nr:hypothetical protein SeMB42_g04185 [Synchytrium endobioticum]
MAASDGEPKGSTNGLTPHFSSPAATTEEEKMLASWSPYTKDRKHLAAIEHLMRPLDVHYKSEGGAKYSVIKSLAQFMQVDALVGDIRYECNNCFKLKYGDKPVAVQQNGIRGNGNQANDSNADGDMVNGCRGKEEEMKVTLKGAPRPSVSENEPLSKDGSSRHSALTPDDFMSKSTPDHATLTESMTASIIRCNDEKDDLEITEIPLLSNDDDEPLNSLIGGVFDADFYDMDKGEECQNGDYGCRKATETSCSGPLPVLSPGRKRYLFAPTPRPDVLVLHLKRFSQATNGKIRKVEDTVEFDEVLDLSPFVVDMDVLEAADRKCGGEMGDEGTKVLGNSVLEEQQLSPLRYKLYGIVVHSGSTWASGHYYAYVRLPEELKKEVVEEEATASEWIYASDTHTRSASWEEARKSEAYMLFYERLVEQV